jgi:uncharacterized membrane protein YGL010W
MRQVPRQCWCLPYLCAAARDALPVKMPTTASPPRKIRMRNLEQQITQYAAYHRDRRNIATHFVGVPMIVFSVVLALVPWTIFGVNFALIALSMTAVYYLRLDIALGTAMLGFLFFFCYLVAVYLNARVDSTGLIMALAATLFVIGWVIQFVGHKFEGMKPAFTDDIMGLVIGPLFIMTELFFALGLKPGLKKYVEARVGPVLAARNGAPIGPVAAPVHPSQA